MLPVYNVVQSGATATQAANLAASLNIPATQLIFSNGVVSYLDSANFLRVPTMPVTDTNAINQLLADTVNPYPAVPINFEQVDLATLSNLVVLDDNTALRTASNTLASAGLSPQYGVPAIAHATLTVAYSNAAASIYSSNRLDTQVNYVFRDPAGYPFVGPGAQVQVAFGATGNVTRLLYATRQMTPGPPVPIIPSSMASNSFAGMFPPGTAFSMDIEYICPPFWPNPFRPCPCPPPPPCNVQTILPYYVAQGTFTVTDALSGQTNSAQTLRLSIPATTNSAWVPAATLVVYPMGTNGIQAYASVTGGTPPYTYIWSGSPGDLGTNNTGSSVSYVPVVRVAPPTLQISRATSAPNALAVSWVPCDPRWCDPPLPWLLENASDFLAGSNGWTPVTNSVQSSNGVNTVTIFGTAVPLFFRLRLGAPTLPVNEVVWLTVIDANGVLFQTGQTVAAQAVAEVPHNVIYVGSVLSYGTESSVDPGLGTADRADWTAAMATPGGGAGVQQYLFTSSGAWPGDFIDPPVPFTLPPNPQFNGDDDYQNWGVDTANLVFYIGHGSPDVITFAKGNLFYNNPQLSHSWGDDALNWLCFLSCDVLAFTNSYGLNAAVRWGGAFNGLHSLTGFGTLAGAGSGFPGALSRGRCWAWANQPRRLSNPGSTVRRRTAPGARQRWVQWVRLEFGMSTTTTGARVRWGRQFGRRRSRAGGTWACESRKSGLRGVECPEY